MQQVYARHPGLTLALMFALVACSAAATPDPTPRPSQPAAPASQPAAPASQPGTAAPPAAAPTAAPAAKAPAAAAPTAVPTRGPNPNIIGLRQGLANLNSYKFTLRSVQSGPAPQEREETVMIVQADNAAKATLTRNESRQATATRPNPEVDIDETYVIGLQQCSVSDVNKTPRGNVSTLNALREDMNKTVSGLTDITFDTQGATFAGEEVIDGIPTNHFTVAVTRLGKDSGAVVRSNRADYWVAKDGQYLVKSNAVLEIAASAQGQAIKAEVEYLLTAVNKPVKIEFPAVCKK